MYCRLRLTGSGKSTLIKFIIAALGVNPEEEVCYVAYTGKAATVLASKGCPNATTAHKLLYWAKPLKNGGYKYVPKATHELLKSIPSLPGPPPPKVIVVDEISMLPKKMWELLLSHHIYILAAGDPGQLPPVVEKEDNLVLQHPHVFLDEIMRQAQDSEIIRLSMHIRDGRSLSSYKGTKEQVLIYPKNEVSEGMYAWADQIICAKNDTRNSINQQRRKMLGFETLAPCVGDKIISLRNHWDICSENTHTPLTNGTIGTLTDFYLTNIQMPFGFTRKWSDIKNVDILVGNMKLEENDDYLTGLTMDYNEFITGQSTLTPAQMYNITQSHKRTGDPEMIPMSFTYAYAITCWKAQGSEYGKVLLFEENFPFKKDEHQKYLYTGITRASDKVVLITK